MKLIKLYEELKKQVEKEGVYLDNKEINEREIIKNTDKKKIIIDKIEKEKIKIKDLSDQKKDQIKQIINDIEKYENENREKYKKMMTKTKDKLMSLRNEKSLNKTYGPKPQQISRFDKKK